MRARKETLLQEDSVSRNGVLSEGQGTSPRNYRGNADKHAALLFKNTQGVSP